MKKMIVLMLSVFFGNIAYRKCSIVHETER